MKQLLSQEQLEVQFTVPDFVLKTKQQIAKDFNSSGIPFNEAFITDELNYFEISSIVSQKLLEVMRTGETALLQLLYQIDIPQSQFLGIVQEKDLSDQLADLVIRREAYKVFLRSKF
jgi:hypothetical protein